MTYNAWTSVAKELLKTGYRHTPVADKSVQVLTTDPGARGKKRVRLIYNI